MKISSLDKNIKDLLSSSYYIIPRFQRPYSWDVDNISDFWSDTIESGETEYFIGSMVVFKASHDKHSIVDGQQRLTTITMILCALRNALNNEGFKDLAQGIHSLIERNNIDNKPEYVLSPETSFPYFQEYIQKFGSPSLPLTPRDEEKNIQASYDAIYSYINTLIASIKSSNTSSPLEVIQERVKNRLLEVRDKILNLKLIFIDLDDEDDAYMIFETLNTRGKDLNVSDLVKNLLVKSIPSSGAQVDSTKILWGAILTLLEESSADLNIDNFLHHYWLSKHDYITLKKLFKAIKKYVKRDNAQSFLNELHSDSITYREIHDIDYKEWKTEESPIRNSLSALSIFRVKQQIPIVLSVMREYKNGKLKIKHIDNILSAIENFHFIFTAITSQRSSGGISLMYASAAKKLDSAQSLDDKLAVLHDLKKRLIEKIPKYEEFESNFSEFLYTNKITKHKDLVKYILTCILAHTQKSYVIDPMSMTIEHILPQNPKIKSALTDIDIGQFGNLLLVSPELNNKLSNKSFSDKKNILTKNKYYIDEVLKTAKVWGQKEINNRTKWLAKLAYEDIWKIR